MPQNDSRERLVALLIEPREDLDIEIKNWLGLRDDANAKATFAKAALALANHGGGFILIGLTEVENRFVEAADRPQSFDAYSQDRINGILQYYADPSFHCRVELIPDPGGTLFPVVVIPGEHRVPIRARRSGPHGNIIQQNAIYIRKPGPRSEVPQTAEEWDRLLARCLANRRDEMFNQVRALMTGAVEEAPAALEGEELDQWIEQSMARWRALIADLPEDDAARCPHGYQWFAFRIGGLLRGLSGVELRAALRASELNHSGWPPFWYPPRLGIAPYPFDNLIECWIGNDTEEGYPAHTPSTSDFWRVSPDGLAFLLRGFREDELGPRPGRPAPPPGSLFEVTWPVRLTGEVFLYAQKLAGNLVDGPATLTLAVGYCGLEGRQLTSLRDRYIREGRRARQNEFTSRTTVGVEAIGPNLPEIVHPLLAPLYALFDFFELPADLVAAELADLRRERFN